MATEKTTAARPYASAAFEFARENDKLNTWSPALQLAADISTDPSADAFFDHPEATPEEHYELVADICGSSLDTFQQNFIRLLAERGRLSVLPQIAEIYEKKRADFEQTIVVDVQSYTALSDQQKDIMKKKLEARYKRRVDLQCSVDKSLLGGIVITADGEVVDGSVRSKLSKMATALAS